MSSRGKAGVQSGDRVRGANEVAKAAPAPAAAKRDGDCGCGCGGAKKEQAAAPAPVLKPAANVKPRINAKQRVAQNPTRAAALARRQAQSTRGKAGVSAQGITPAQTARAANPQLSGRELAQALRSQRSTKGNGGQKKSQPSGRVRPTKPSASGAAEDQPWKVGASETVRGQTVTGTMVGRKQGVTGDEPSTCRAITGTEYLGADIFRAFCGTEPGKSPAKVRKSPTSHGNTVTGNEVGRSNKVTGDEPGTCKNVTGTEYVGANQSLAFCGTDTKAGPAKVTSAETRKGKSVTGNNVGRAGKVTGDETGANRELTGTQYTKAGDIGNVPPKVGKSATLRGGSVTGSLVGRSERVTGDEPGTCRNITGDDYVGQEQYKGFCSSTPAPKDQKVGVSLTAKGGSVTGTQTGRGNRVTGDEPGTCKAITGTPYAGAEQYKAYCQPEDDLINQARTAVKRGTAGSVMTGIQPAIGGKMTGERGACEPATGTPYVGADQVAAACAATAAEPNSPDFPQALGNKPWTQFSVESPSHASQTGTEHAAVTGSRYEQGQITGPFGMATGKVTGTEEARFGRGNGAAAPAPAAPETAPMVEGRVKPRISGEGMDAGVKITGDDWDRGDRVTGTEGMTATGRNPTRRGPMNALAMAAQAKRNEEVPAPVSKVTGSSGNTEKGSLITYSGGARG